MKKFIFLLALTLIVSVASAQIGAVKTTTAKTLVDAATVTSDVITVTGQCNAITIQTVYTQVAGTTSVTATVSGSVDGVKYVTLSDVAGLVKGFPSITPTSVGNGYIYDVIVQGVPFNYYKVTSLGAGTQTTTVTTKYVLK